MKVPVAALAAVLALSACQDPAGVGLGLIDEEQLDPAVETLPLTDLRAFDDSTVAIGIASAADPAQSQRRVLVGEVLDPAFGDVRAVAYVDARRSTSLDADATADDVSAIWLELHRSGYVYGDTTTTLPLEVREIEGDWEASTGYAPDTTFSVGGVLATATVAQADTLVRFDLPDAWVDGNASSFVASATDFFEAFEGLAVSTAEGFAPTPGAVFGFDTFETDGSGYRVVVGEDTLVYPLSEVFSSVQTDAPVAPPSDVFRVRSQSQSSVRFDADLASLGPAALARAVLRLPLATSFLEEGPFVRPIARSAFLYGTRGEGAARTRRVLALVSFDESGEATIANQADFTDALQAVLLSQNQPFDAYELVPDPATASLNVLPVRMTDGGGARFTFTVVGSGR